MEDILKDLYRIVQSLDEGLVLSELEGLSPKVRAALRFLEEDFCKGVGLGQAADQVRISREALCRMVRKELTQHEIYITLPDYLDRLKVDTAKEFFRSDPLLACKEVASFVGICPRSLRRIFKKYTGKTPTEYKMQIAHK